MSEHHPVASEPRWLTAALEAIEEAWEARQVRVAGDAGSPTEGTRERDASPASTSPCAIMGQTGTPTQEGTEAMKTQHPVTTIACEIGKHKLCKGQGVTPQDDPFTCQCPCHHKRDDLHTFSDEELNSLAAIEWTP